MQRVGYVKRLCAMGVFVDSRNSRRTEIATGSSTNRGTYHRARRAVWLLRWHLVSPILQRQLGQSCPPSTQSILSTPSSKPPPAGGGLVVATKNFGIFREWGRNWRIFLKLGSVLKFFFKPRELGRNCPRKNWFYV